MTPTEVLSLAQRLIEKEQCAAGYRCTISRAYYAAFLEARRFIEKAGHKFKSGGDNVHKNVQAILSNTGDNELDTIGPKLQFLHGHRRDADYQLDKKGTETKESAEDRIREATDIMSVLGKCLQAQQRFSVVSIKITERADFRKEGPRTI